jgi:UDP-galactopyranose mutase
MTRILVVGAGFAGAVHARELADAGIEVDVIDQRDHIGGNAHDAICATGQRVHRYGPHLFHTNNEAVMRWIERFAAFVPYQHRVQALLADGRRVPLPVNRTTINTVFGVRLADEAAVRDFLASRAEPHAAPVNAADHLYATIGRVLTDLFFRPYTRKMWALDLEEMDAAVVQRIPIRFDDEDRYFPTDRFQMLPRDGYANLFGAMLDHPRIRVTLRQAFDQPLRAGFAHCFNSMPIDEFFACRFGPLPYRSIRFHHVARPLLSHVGVSHVGVSHVGVSHAGMSHPATPPQGESNPSAAATLNFTDDGPITRETDWSALPAQPTPIGAMTTLTREEPCDYLANDRERYYPVKTSDGRYQAVYARYKALADATPGVSFIGRCGTYQYLDMHQVINQSLTHVRAWLRDQLGSAAGSRAA